MRRITVSLSDDLAAGLDREARRHGVSVAQLVREGIEARLGRTAAGRRQLTFAALGRSGHHSTARNLEETLREEWALDRDG